MIDWPFIVYSLAAIGLVVLMIAISYFLGERRRSRETHEVYESGVEITGQARTRYSTQFYLIAMLFVIFDLEAVFLFAWAIAVAEAGWTGFAGAGVFLVILSAALVYEWRMGALDMPNRRKGRTLAFLKRQADLAKER